MELNRGAEPAAKPLSSLTIPQPEKITLSNGIPLYKVNAGTQEVLRFEIVFNAGSWYQDKALQASTVAQMLSEGTEKIQAKEIAEQLDKYGAVLRAKSDKDFTVVAVYTLNKHVEKVFPIVEEVLKNASFPEKELGIYLQNARQKFLVDNEKVNTLARRQFLQTLYGQEHPYGAKIEVSDFDNIDRTALDNYRKNYFIGSNCFMIASGLITNEIEATIEKHFGNANWYGNGQTGKDGEIPQPITKEQQVTAKKGAVQAAVRAGRILFNKLHEDYQKFTVVNTILGGYFGSRLMANIREEKGYTYGINSGVVSLINSGYFFIATEVGAEVSEQTMEEIHKELKILRTEIVPKEELDLVKNYMMGQLMRSFDGPFAIADQVRGMVCYNLDSDYLKRFVNTIKQIKEQEVIELADKYLQENDMVEVIVGPE